MSNRATFHQTLALLTVVLNELSLGIVTGWLPWLLGTALFDLRDKTGTYLTWLICLAIVGKIFGVTLAAILLDKVGRKSLLSICAITFCLPWLAISFTNSIYVFCVTSAAFGIASGINEVSNTAYLGENCSPSTRGILGTISISTYFLGFLIGSIPEEFFSSRILFIVNFFITLLSFISAFWMIEPVQHLLMKGKYDQAKENFVRLNDINDPDQLTAEFEKIRQNVYAETSKKSSCGKMFTSPANCKSLIIILTIYSLAGMTGYQHIQPFIYYQFVNFILIKHWSFYLGCVQFLTALLSSFIINRLKRRSVIIIAFSLISLAQALIAMLYLIRQLVPVPYDSYDLGSICVVISEMFMVSAYALSYSTLFILRSELFPLSIKGVGSCMTIMVQPVMIIITQLIIELFGFNYYFSCILFSVFSAILVLFVCYKLPETGNKSLIEIQESL